jgi:gluconokinase
LRISKVGFVIMGKVVEYKMIFRLVVDYLAARFVMGVDIGTTSTKAVLYLTDGSAYESAYAYYPLLKENPEMAEQDLDDIYSAVLQTIKAVIQKAEIGPQDVAGIGFSSAMHSLLLMDADGHPLTRSITWADNRSKKYASMLKKSDMGQRIYEKTGTPLHPMSPLSKILWLKAERPELFQRARWFIGIKEYVLWRLFGEFVIDYSVASATGLFNIRNFAWDEEVLAFCGITGYQLSTPVSPTHQLQGLPEDIAELLGIDAQTPFIIGGNDGCLANLGVGAIRPGTATLTIGTSGAVRMTSHEPHVSKEGRTFSYILDERHFVNGGAVNNGGNVFDWALKQFMPSTIAEEEIYDRAMEMVSNIPAGSEGLVFHPYLNGERAPLWNADVRGNFSGINMLHTKEHFLRAVLEGICLNLKDVLDLIVPMNGKPNKIIASGGFSRSHVWRQVLTDIIGMPIEFPETFESSCTGAAVLCLQSLGIVESVDDAEELMGAAIEHQPNSENQEAYAALFPQFQKMSRLLNDFYGGDTE